MKLSDAENTVRFALQDAMAETAHLHRLRADSPGIEQLISAILDQMRSPAVSWAFKMVSSGGGVSKP